MCGVIGCVIGTKKRTPSEYEIIRNDFSTMLVAAQSRGTDAAGLYVFNEGGECFSYRAPMQASTLVTLSEYWAVLDRIGPTTIAVVGHTRAATTGSPSVNSNNHPLKDGPLVGVHNGMIYNHRSLRAKYGTEAEVDSAVILSLLNSRMVDGDYLNESHLVHSLKELEGSFAIAVADTRTNNIFLARNAGSPLVMASNSRKGLLWFGSTQAIIASGLGRPVSVSTLPVGAVMKLGRKDVTGAKPLHWTPFIQRSVKRPLSPREDSRRSSFTQRRSSSRSGMAGFASNDDAYQSWFFDEGAGTAAALRAAERGE